MTQAIEAAQAKLKGYLDEVKPLQKARSEGALTDDQRKRASELAGLIKDVGGELDRLKGEDDTFSQLGSLAEYLGKAPAGKTAPLLGGADDPDQRERMRKGGFSEFLKSEGYKRMAQRGVDGGATSGSFRLGERYQRGGGGPLLTGNETPEQLRTLIYEGATANLINDVRLPGIYRGDRRENMVRDAFSSGRVDGTSVSYVRENVVTSNAAAIVEATSTTPGPAGAQFPESAITFTVQTETVKNLGHMIPVTREMLDDVALMESYIESRMMEMLDDKIDSELLNGAGGNSLTGLYNVSGISALDATYWSANGLPSAGLPGENVDRIRRARTYHKITNRARASHVLIHPYDLEDIEFLRDSQANYLFPPGTIAQRMGGLTVVETESATRKLPIVIDKRFFAVLDKMETSVEVTNSNREWFEYRILALAVWWRGMEVAFRPAAAATVQLV